MKVTVKESTIGKQFIELEAGSKFMLSGCPDRVYIKTQPFKSGNGVANSIIIVSGARYSQPFCTFCNNEEVIPVVIDEIIVTKI